MPPTGFGIDKPVRVFSELRRIALMSAIAEQLRNQALLPGGLGEYVGAIPYVVTITLVVSFFVAMFMTVAICCFA